MMIRFDVPLIPTAKGRPRFSVRGGFARAYTDVKTEAAETTFALLAAPYAPPEPFTGPLSLTLHFTLGAPAGWPRWRRGVIDLVRHQKKPDLDNLVKLVMDALNRSGRFWRDDSQVCHLVTTKGYGERPGTLVVIDELTQPERHRP